MTHVISQREAWIAFRQLLVQEGVRISRRIALCLTCVKVTAERHRENFNLPYRGAAERDGHMSQSLIARNAAGATIRWRCDCSIARERVYQCTER